MNKSKSLTPKALDVLIQKGTEPPFYGKYNNFSKNGTYCCRLCGLALFRSSDKFLSSCGWPSFDDELPNAIERFIDKDGFRTEICCKRCSSHLGHVFQGEGLTEKNLRHCVNSIAVDFVESTSILDSSEAIVAGGCFWGVEHCLRGIDGVVATEVGYTGGSLDNPSYDDVCRGQSGHYEAVRVVFDESYVSYKKIIEAFLECHDPTQANGQGLDIGPQYQSAIFCYEGQDNEARDRIAFLIEKGANVATKCLPVTVFWPAEEYHQDYIAKHPNTGSCHFRTKRF